MDRAIDVVLVVPSVLAVGLVLLGYRDRQRVDLSDQLCTVLATFLGMLVAVFIELVEFISDWVVGTQLQPSNSGTMLDFLAADVSALLAAILATTLYCHVLQPEQRQWLGLAGSWLSDGPSQVLDKHGFAITLAVTAIVLIAVASLWFAGRPVPGFPIG